MSRGANNFSFPSHFCSSIDTKEWKKKTFHPTSMQKYYKKTPLNKSKVKNNLQSTAQCTVTNQPPNPIPPLNQNKTKIAKPPHTRSFPPKTRNGKAENPFVAQEEHLKSFCCNIRATSNTRTVCSQLSHDPEVKLQNQNWFLHSNGIFGKRPWRGSLLQRLDADNVSRTSENRRISQIFRTITASIQWRDF